MRPIIAITGNTKKENNRIYNHLNYTYVNAILKAGGMPVILPVFRQDAEVDEYIDRVDGILFSGGEDISPLMFDENPVKEVSKIDYKRDAMEKKLFKAAFEKKVPILGVCRGMQIINVLLGGTLYQDIHKQLPDILGHDSGDDTTEGYHMIKIEKDSTLEKIFGKDKASVNSEHHQALKDVAKGFKVTAKSYDGLVEAMEWEGDQYLKTYQFHPEAMVDNIPEFLGIFKDFVNYCKK